MSDEDLSRLAEELGRALRSRHWRLSTAESCTGGWIAKCVTDIAGSSVWMDRGFVTYSNQAKQEMLGVSAELLDRHGAVSEATVKAMTGGALANSLADIAVAVSGIAGPGGGSIDKPVGTVWFSWQRKGRPAQARRECFAGDRQAVRRQTVALALRRLTELASGND